METKPSSIWTTRQLLGLALGLVVASAVFHLVCAARGHPIYRDMHLGTALVYAQTRIDLLRPIIVGFNANNEPTPQELPLWQAATALVFKAFGPWFGWANLVSLVLFSSCLYPLYQLASSLHDRRTACWTLIFFLSQPLIFLEAGVAGTDGFSLASVIWFVFLAQRLIEKPGALRWLLTALAATVAAVTKLPFFMAGGVAIFLFVVARHRQSVRVWAWLAAAAACSGVVFLIWSSYTNACYARALYPYVDLHPSSPFMKNWFFGDWHYRLSLGNWIHGGWRMLNACFASPAAAGLGVASLLFSPRRGLGRAWLAGAFITTLIFTHLVLVHWHYYLMYTPAMALLCGVAAATLESRFSLGGGWKSCLGLVILAVALGAAIAEGLDLMKFKLSMDPYLKDLAPIVQKYTQASDKLLISEGGWGGDELFLSGRQGLSIWDTQWLEDQTTLRHVKELGFNRVVLISESPLQLAYRMTTPGKTATPRVSYNHSLTAVVSNWPTVYQDENILIKQVP